MNKPPFKLSRWLFGSIQRQLALTFGSVSLLMMLILVGLLLKQQQYFLDDASIRRATALANGLAYSSSSWVLANDVVGLSEVLQGYSDTPNLDRAFILSKQGQVLASTQAQDVGLFVSDPISIELLTKPSTLQVLIANADMIDVAAPIMVDKRQIGWVRVGLNQQATQSNLHALLINSLELIIITSFIMLIFSALLAKGMTRRLQQLIAMARKIANGDRSIGTVVQRGDEIDNLAININQILDSLMYSERQLDRLNHVYAAWTESVATIVRETDESTLLNRICEILVEKIDLRLVFVGLIDDNNDWITVVASSDWQSSYLQNLKISVNPLRPEARGPLGLAIREQQPQIFNDFLSRQDTAPWHDAARASSIHAVAGFPLTRAGKVIGGITVYSQEVNYFNTDIITLLSGLAADVSFALDNFDRERQRQQAETELTLAASVFENSQEGIFITDADKIIVRVNNAFSRLTGHPAEDVIGCPYYQQMPVVEQQDLVFCQSIWEQVDSQGYWQNEIINYRKDGSRFPEWLTITRVADKNNQTTHYVGIFVDITEQKENEKRVHKLAFYDVLTQLPNRRLLMERLHSALVASQRSQHYGVLMFMDLDHFKIINDTHGHDLGDQLLIEVSQRISACVRKNDTVARLGGDEFVVMLENLATDVERATLLAQQVSKKILHSLDQPYLLHYFDAQGHSLTVNHHSSASIGMKLFQGIHVSSDDLLKQADMAMYQAKQAGRNTLRIFDPDMQAKLNYRVQLETDMRLAMQDNQFHLAYQAQVDTRGYLVGAEVLLRWTHPQRGGIPPAEFIPLAEESGLIGALGMWVLRESCKTLANWAKKTETQQLNLAVNVSAKQFSQEDFVEQIKTILNTTGVNPRRLKLEITESIILANVNYIIGIMNSLRELGISFSMDDFGTGYSSLTYLQRLPLSQLKIDQSFVRDLAVDSNDAAIIRTILALGSSLDISVVAEGVETQQQRDYLLSSGCQIFQGYLFGKPEPLAVFEQRFMTLKKAYPNAMAEK